MSESIAEDGRSRNKGVVGETSAPGRSLGTAAVIIAVGVGGPARHLSQGWGAGPAAVSWTLKIRQIKVMKP